MISTDSGVKEDPSLNVLSLCLKSLEIRLRIILNVVLVFHSVCTSVGSADHKSESIVLGTYRVHIPQPRCKRRLRATSLR